MTPHDHDHDGGHDHDEPRASTKGATGEKDPHDDRAAHSHDHAPKDFGRAFLVGIVLQSAFVVGEVIVGLASNSLAVIADAGHNVSDVLALALAWAATRLGKRKATKGRTYGLKSASILAALFNSMTLVFVNGAVGWEALLRLRSPEPVTALPMIIVSSLGIAVNGFCAWLFTKGSEDDVNVRAAFLHLDLASDAAVAAGVALTGVAIHFTGIRWLDPVASMVVSGVVLVSTWSLLRRALNLAMHAVPQGIDEAEIRQWLIGLPDVVSVHDLHVWAISTSENALSTHVVVREMPSGAFACDIDKRLRAEFPIHHVTIQIDPAETPCALAKEEAI